MDIVWDGVYELCSFYQVFNTFLILSLDEKLDAKLLLIGQYYLIPLTLVVGHEFCLLNYVCFYGTNIQLKILLMNYRNITLKTLKKSKYIKKTQTEVRDGCVHMLCTIRFLRAVSNLRDSMDS